MRNLAVEDYVRHRHDPDSHAERGRCRSGVTLVSVDIIRITDETSREDIAEAITHLNDYAKHQQHHVDNARWVTAHRRIDALLCDWERVS